MTKCHIRDYSSSQLPVTVPAHMKFVIANYSQDSSTGSQAASSRHGVDFGKFYNTSYLAKPMGAAVKGPSINPSDRKPTHFHRPGWHLLATAQ